MGGDVGLKAYVAALAALSLALAASCAHQFGVELGPRYVVGAVAFGAVLALAELFPVRVGDHSEVSAVDAGLVLASVVLGPLWAVPAAFSCALVEGNGDPLRTSHAAARNAAEVLLAGAAFSFVTPPLLSSGDPVSKAAAVYATLAAAAVLLVANNALDACLLKAKYGQAFGQTWEDVLKPYLLSDAVNVLTASLGTLALLSYGPVAAVVLVAGSVGSQALVLRSREHARRSRELETENAALKRALAGAGMTFGSLAAEALGRKDGYTHRHAAATAVYAADLAREMKLGEKRAEELRLAGLLHDVGMAFLPEELLLAGGRANSVAQRELAEHPALGEAALASVPGYEELSRWVRWHHERPDGRGYPDKLRGSWIPVEAKILAVAQAHADLVLDGPSCPGVPPREARERLAADMDAGFDGTVLKAFLRILDTESEGYRNADDHRFVLPGRSGPRGVLEEDAAGAPS
ncbi:MAG: hypothetical protein AVDCRST_MAG02-121 [uncultured Rubrobacteraceae bacterium]|uniref:HD-GYP domain-containing protein n=1 Tax=uncultured Rubrobacteraceae bacterium TaxID=349277 RepID=A0A6J4QGZ8_9ACTN|nr:MAG: hypothetical protein AVDCRST_MAG02-121 [uncultured Rubrobacteraceae bacterium]